MHDNIKYMTTFNHYGSRSRSRTIVTVRSSALSLTLQTMFFKNIGLSG